MSLAACRSPSLAVGGTGSAVIEQLVRLGVRRLHLFDPDILTASNLTRVYGSSTEMPTARSGRMCRPCRPDRPRC